MWWSLVGMNIVGAIFSAALGFIFIVDYAKNKENESLPWGIVFTLLFISNALSAYGIMITKV